MIPSWQKNEEMLISYKVLQGGLGFMAKTRGDARVDTLERKIEKGEGLRPGSVKIVDPKSNKDVRGDKKVENVRKG